MYLVYGLLGPIAAFAKMGTVPLLIIALLGYPSIRSMFQHLKKLALEPLGLAVLALLGWCCISLIWAEQPNPLTLLRLAAVTGLAFLLPALISTLDQPSKKTLKNILIGSFVFVLAVLLIEGLTGAWLHRQLRPLDAIPREGEWVPYLEMVAARGTAMLAPFSFLVAAFISRKSEQKILGLGFVTLSCIAAYMLPMEASAIAIVIGAIAYIATRWRPKFVLKAIFLSCAAAMIISPIAVSNLLNQADLASMGVEVSRNEAQRLVIWEFTAQEVLKHPILGHGFDSSRVIGARDNSVEGTNWQALPLHPHNAFLQIWLELGLIGIILTCFVIWGMWRQILKWSSNPKDLAICAATWCAVLTIALISFGIWQYWWIAMWGLLCGALTLVPQRPEAS